MIPLDMSSSLPSYCQHSPTCAILSTLGPCLASSIQHARMSSPAHWRMRVSFSLILMFVFTDISPRLSGTVLTSSLWHWTTSTLPAQYRPSPLHQTRSAQKTQGWCNADVMLCGCVRMLGLTSFMLNRYLNVLDTSLDTDRMCLVSLILIWLIWCDFLNLMWLP